VPAPAPGTDGRVRILALALFALFAFAANSVLCRVALGGHAIDAASFTLLRLASGAAILLVIRAASRPAASRPAAPSASRRGWTSAVMLFLYAAAFSFAYVTLAAGTGALILFGAVQATMILAALRSGERFQLAEAIGLACALGGLVYLVSPGLSAPSPIGSALMAVAGIAWGIYSLRGRGTEDPVGDTTRNFVRAVPFAILVSLVAVRSAAITPRGAMLAMVSGAVTSGVGYVIWYAALRGLTAIRAATVQLAVPAIAAVGGVIVLGEAVTLRLMLSATLILGGVAVAISRREEVKRYRSPSMT